MPVVSCADFARIAGVSRAAITQAAKPKDGKPPRLAIEADGTINTDLPINKAYIDEKRTPKRPAAPAPKPAPRPADPPLPRDTVSPPENIERPDDLEEEDEIISATLEAAAEKLKYTRARRINAEADTRLKNLREAREKEITVLRELVVRRFAGFDACLKTNFRDLPRRISAQVTAIAASEGQAAVERYLEAQISAALVRSKDEAKKQGLAE